MKYDKSISSMWGPAVPRSQNSQDRSMGPMLSRILGFVILLLAFQGYAQSPSMSDYTTCAVYHRMLASAFKRDRDLPIMAELEIEKMDAFISKAKEATVTEYGEDLAEELFQDEWNAVLMAMTDQINRSYKNVSRLKVRYRGRCVALR